MQISELQHEVNQLLEQKGFKARMEQLRRTAGEEQLGYYLGALLATEPAEYIDAVKKGKGVEAELEEAADTIIRAMNIFIMHNASAEQAIRAKISKNFARPVMYGHGEGK